MTDPGIGEALQWRTWLVGCTPFYCHTNLRESMSHTTVVESVKGIVSFCDEMQSNLPKNRNEATVRAPKNSPHISVVIVEVELKVHCRFGGCCRVISIHVPP
jgi:hypothetical protein